MAPCEFKLTRRIEFAETDMAGIVHFANFYRMMESTEHAFFRSLGLSIDSRVDERHYGWPRVNASCDFRGPLRFEDEVEIHLLITEVRARSLRYEFIFRKIPERIEVARGRMATVCACVDRAYGKLAAVRIPDDIRERIRAAPIEVLAENSAVAAK